MKTGMVILNYNDYQTTLNLIKQIQIFELLKSIVIVDNCSTDDSFVELEKLSNEKIKVIQTEANNGYSSGNNVGIKTLLDINNVDYIVISNPDIVIKGEDFNKLIQTMMDNEQIDLIAPIIKQGDETISGWRLPTFKDDLLSNIVYFHHHASKKMKYPNQYFNDLINEVEVVSGCFFIIKREVLEEINYFDENVFLYYEENILGNKLKAKGYKTYICSEVNVIHDLSVSIDRSVKRLKKYKILKQSQRYYQKNYNNANMIQITLLYLTYLISYCIAFVIAIFRRK